MAFLVRDQFLHRAPDNTLEDVNLFQSVKPVEAWHDIEEYMLIRQNGQTIGASATTVRKLNPVTTATYVADMRMAAKLSPLLPQINVKLQARLNRLMSLTNFNCNFDAGPVNVRASGATLDNLLYIKVDNAGKINRMRTKLEKPISLAEALRPTLGRHLAIKPGSRTSTEIIDPLSGINRGTLTIAIKEGESVKVDGKELEAYKVISRLQDIETIMWVDKDGRTLKRQIIGNIVMERTSEAEALKAEPSLAMAPEYSELDVEEFRGVPVRNAGETEPDSSKNSMGTMSTLLNAVLN